MEIMRKNITNSITDNDRINIVTYTINYFVCENKYNEIKNKLFENNFLIDFIIKNKITMTKFIRSFNTKIVNNTNIGDIIRTTIYYICLCKKYNFLDDKNLLGFLVRTHTGKKCIKFTGMKYNSLKEIDKLIANA